MNISFNLNEFNTQCIFLTEKKQNTIIQGIFTKILYSTDIYTMIGIYLKMPIYLDKGASSSNSYINYSSLQSGKNLFLISSIEEQILNLYKNQTKCTKQPIYSLRMQLLYGSLKIYKESANELYYHTYSNELTQIDDENLIYGNYDNSINEVSCNKKNALHEKIKFQEQDENKKNECQTNSGCPTLILKIAGIWENKTHYGITFKFLQEE